MSNYKVNASELNRVSTPWEVIEIPGAQGKPVIEDAQEKLRCVCRKTSCEKYGDMIPEKIEERLLQELNYIFDNQDEAIYLTLADVLLQEGVKSYYKNYI